MDSRSPKKTIFEVDTKSGVTITPLSAFDRNSDNVYLEDDILYPNSGYLDTLDTLDSPIGSQCLDLILIPKLSYIPNFGENYTYVIAEED